MVIFVSRMVRLFTKSCVVKSTTGVNEDKKDRLIYNRSCGKVPWFKTRNSVDFSLYELRVSFYYVLLLNIDKDF